jgi:c(7)-type cytochrome triheme protein
MTRTMKSALNLGLALAALLAVDTVAPSAAQAQEAGTQKVAQANSANRFNRLMKTGVDANASPMQDGIHDPGNSGTEALQPPKEAFADLPKSTSGNRIDWVKALNDGAVTPRAKRDSDNAQTQILDMDIIRIVKGSMPDVVYPHKPHTQWLDCAQCHPGIFVPKKGGNAISMAAILMGQYCGVCHGKVAFPVSECSKCHSKMKSGTQQASTAAPVPPPPPAAAKPASSGPLSRENLMEKGKGVYDTNCSGCHGENGEGVPGTFPALKGSKIARGPVAEHLKIVLKGKADTAMQPWADTLSDEEVAAVVTFERNAWGNNTGDLVQPSQVKSAK